MRHSPPAYVSRSYACFMDPTAFQARSVHCTFALPPWRGICVHVRVCVYACLCVQAQDANPLWFPEPRQLLLLLVRLSQYLCSHQWVRARSAPLVRLAGQRASQTLPGRYIQVPRMRQREVNVSDTRTHTYTHMHMHTACARALAHCGRQTHMHAWA